MTRSSAFFGILFGLVLAWGAVAGEVLRASHALAAAGQTSMVICGQDGLTRITLDRDGTPVDPAGDCTHCNGCLLQPLNLATGHPAPQFIAGWNLMAQPPLTAPVRLDGVWNSEARGPPIKSRTV